ncbi:ATP-binding protein [bacterium]|nr:ATP-binding protein [bacterium]
MITRIEALNYRCLHYVNQELGSFHVLAGSNASGKSTFLDVIALMADVVKTGPLRAVLDRTPDYRKLFWMGEGGSFELAIEASVPEEPREPVKDSDYDHCRYELAVGVVPESGEIGILSERLWLFEAELAQAEQLDVFPRTLATPKSIMWRSKHGRRTLINKVRGGNDNFYSETGKFSHAFRLGPQKSALANVPDDVAKFPVSIWFKRALSEGTQVLALKSATMRRPSPPGMPRDLLPDGSNLPWVLHNLRRVDEERLRQWVAHVRMALTEIADVDTVERPEDKHRYIVLKYENGLKVPSWLVSDGTLRFLALTVLPYLPGMRGVYLIEEPENGIHPKAVEAVYQSLSSVYQGQVLLATHSPIFLTLSDPSHLLCFAINDEGAADIVEGSRHPRLTEWRKDVTLGDLFATGVLG